MSRDVRPSGVRALLVALLAFVAACSASSSPPDVTSCEVFDVRVSPSLPPDARESFARALATWRGEVTGDAFRYELRETSDAADAAEACTVQVVGGAAAGDVGEVAREVFADGRTRSAIVYVDEGAEDPDLRYAGLLHEVGHVLGLEHEKDLRVPSCMRSPIFAPGRIGCVDAQRACALWGCAARCEALP